MLSLHVYFPLSFIAIMTLCQIEVSVGWRELRITGKLHSHDGSTLVTMTTEKFVRPSSMKGETFMRLGATELKVN